VRDGQAPVLAGHESAFVHVPVQNPVEDRGAGQVVSYRVQVGWLFRPRLDRGCGLAVSCEAVEPPVHRPLQATARQVE
jgi:hypothetical protein